jgi:curved DNA-binding protein CbpA
MARVPFDPATDYYQLLGVGPAASSDEIQVAYRRLAKEFHPDLHANSSTAAARMARVNAAKSVLLDRDTRAIYDRMRAEQLRYGQAGAQRRSGAGVAVRSSSPGQSTAAPSPGYTTVRYAPGPGSAQPRRRVVSSRAARAAGRESFNKHSAVLFVIAIPLIAALALYVFQAVELSVQPPRTPPADLTLSPGGRPTSRGTAETAFMMLHAQPPSRDLAARVNNFVFQRVDSTPESESLRASARQLRRAADQGDEAAWDAAVEDVCRLAGHCS